MEKLGLRGETAKNGHPKGGETAKLRKVPKVAAKYLLLAA